MTTINRKQFVAFLVGIGFSKATDYTDEVLKSRFPQVAEKVAAAEVPAEQKKLYDSIVAGEVKLDLGEPAEPAGKKPSKVDKAVDAAAKKGAKAAPGKPAAKVKGAVKPAKEEKPAKVKKEPKAKKPAKEVDAYGSYVGTVRANVNAQFSKEWQTDEAIAKAAGVTLKQARSRLRRAARKGLLLVQRTIAYKLASAAPKSK